MNTHLNMWKLSLFHHTWKILLILKYYFLGKDLTLKKVKENLVFSPRA